VTNEDEEKDAVTLAASVQAPDTGLPDNIGDQLVPSSSAHHTMGVYMFKDEPYLFMHKESNLLTLAVLLNKVIIKISDNVFAASIRALSIVFAPVLYPTAEVAQQSICRCILLPTALCSAATLILQNQGEISLSGKATPLKLVEITPTDLMNVDGLDVAGTRVSPRDKQGLMQMTFANLLGQHGTLDHMSLLMFLLPSWYSSAIRRTSTERLFDMLKTFLRRNPDNQFIPVDDEHWVDLVIQSLNDIQPPHELDTVFYAGPFSPNASAIELSQLVRLFNQDEGFQKIIVERIQLSAYTSLSKYVAPGATSVAKLERMTNLMQLLGTNKFPNASINLHTIQMLDRSLLEYDPQLTEDDPHMRTHQLTTYLATSASMDKAGLTQIVTTSSSGAATVSTAGSNTLRKWLLSPIAQQWIAELQDVQLIPVQLLAALAKKAREGSVAAFILLHAAQTEFTGLYSSLSTPIAETLRLIATANLNSRSIFLSLPFTTTFDGMVSLGNVKITAGWSCSKAILTLFNGLFVVETLKNNVTTYTQDMHSAILEAIQSLRQHVTVRPLPDDILDAQCMEAVQSVGSRLCQCIGFNENTDAPVTFTGTTFYEFYAKIIAVRKTLPDSVNLQAFKPRLLTIVGKAFGEAQLSFKAHKQLALTTIMPLIFLSTNSEALILLKSLELEIMTYVSVQRINMLGSALTQPTVVFGAAPRPLPKAPPAPSPAPGPVPSPTPGPAPTKMPRRDLPAVYKTQVAAIQDPVLRSQFQAVSLGGVFFEDADVIKRTSLRRRDNGLQLRVFNKNHLVKLLPDKDKTKYCWPVICNASWNRASQCPNSQHSPNCAAHVSSTEFKQAIDRFQPPACTFESI